MSAVVEPAGPELNAVLAQAPATGGDPRLGERFGRIKEEIEKLSGTDFQQVCELGRQLLSQEGLDLRVLGYLALAALYQQGLAGLAEVCRAYAAVVDTAWDQAHPRRAAAREAAVGWLNQPRFAGLLARAPDLDDADRVRELLEAIGTLNTSLGRRVPGTAVLADLRKALEIRQRQREQTTPRAIPNKTRIAEAPASRGVGSEAELQQYVREMASYLRQQGDWMRLLALHRALRWSAVAPPPQEAGRTRIPRLRPAALAEVEAARARGAWQDTLQAVEAAFLEPGGQFCLLLQVRAAEAAMGLGQPELAALVGQLLLGWLERLPAILDLCFDDGTPFADAEALAWLEARRPRQVPVTPVRMCDEEPLALAAEEALTLAREQGLAAGLARLDQVPVRGGRSRARLGLARADLCLALGRPELALPVLEGLSETLQPLADWEPELAVAVSLALDATLKRAKPSPQRPEHEIKRRLERLRGELCRLDLTTAASLQS